MAVGAFQRAQLEVLVGNSDRLAGGQGSLPLSRNGGFT
jgi:hypothetical protein